MRYFCAIPFYILKILTANVYLEKNTKNRLLELFTMAENAYSAKRLKNNIFNFKTRQGLAAKVFKGDDEVVIAFKGTTPSILGHPLGPSAQNDKRLVELLFACCGSKECTEEKRRLLKVESYFDIARALVKQVVDMYPHKNIVLVGHSLGGSIASLMAHEFRIEAVAFSSPGDQYFMELMGLHDGAETGNVYHIGLCNDPIYMGRCNGAYSLCRFFDYRIETGNHSGKAYCIESQLPHTVMMHRASVLKRLLLDSEYIKEIEQIGHDCAASPYIFGSGLALEIANYYVFDP